VQTISLVTLSRMQYQNNSNC